MHICDAHSSIIHNSQKVETTYLSPDEWINYIWSVYSVEYHLAIKKNGVLINTTKWTSLQNLVSEKFPLWCSGIGSILGTLGRRFDP